MEGQCSRALLAYQVHDRFQQAKQAAFFELAPGYGLRARLLLTTAGERQRTQYSSPDAEPPDGDGSGTSSGGCAESGESGEGGGNGGAEEDVTRQVQLWELVRATREPA